MAEDAISAGYVAYYESHGNKQQTRNGIIRALRREQSFRKRIKLRELKNF